MFKKGDRVSFTGYDSTGVLNYKGWYTLTKSPDSDGFVKAKHGTLKYLDDKEVTIHIAGCKRLIKKKK